MRRALLVPAVLVLGWAALAGVASVQAPPKPDLAGTWAGYANAPGMRFDLTAVFEKTESGYAGKLSDASGAIVEAPLREIVFRDGKLTCELDLLLGGDAMLIKLDLTLENGALKGLWFDVDGNSDVVELAPKK